MHAARSAIPLRYIVDDDDLVVSSVGAVLASVGYEFLCFRDGDGFLATVNEDRPGCILLDIYMHGLDGLQVQRALAERRCTLPVVFISAQPGVDTAVAAMKHGAFDYIEKPVRAQLLLDAVNPAIRLSSERWLERERHGAVHERLSWLTPRERTVLELLAGGGDPSKCIARQLGVSTRTVETHRASIMGKMRAESLAELVRMCVAAGIV